MNSNATVTICLIFNLWKIDCHSDMYCTLHNLDQQNKTLPPRSILTGHSFTQQITRNIFPTWFIRKYTIVIASGNQLSYIFCFWRPAVLFNWFWRPAVLYYCIWRQAVLYCCFCGDQLSYSKLLQYFWRPAILYCCFWRHLSYFWRPAVLCVALGCRLPIACNEPNLDCCHCRLNVILPNWVQTRYRDKI